MENNVLGVSPEEFEVIIKLMDADDVIELATYLNLSWRKTQNKSINRMWATVAIKEHLFPEFQEEKKKTAKKSKKKETAKEKKGKKQKSPWAKFSYEQLERAAKERNLTWTITKNPGINKMWVIHALKKAGVDPSELE